MGRSAARNGDAGEPLPKWGEAAKAAYKAALGIFAVLWVVGIVFTSRSDDLPDAFYVAWGVIGAFGVAALLAWLTAEFVTGRREREM